MDRVLRLGGLVFLSGGAALLAAALLLPRLVDGALVPSWVMLTGLPLVGAGLVLLRRHAEAPAARRSLAICALVPALAGLVVAYAWTDVRQSLAETELTSVSLPGFSLDLPAGKALAQPVRYTVGMHRRTVPGRSGPIEVRWMSTGPMSDSELRRSAEVLVAPAILKDVLQTDLGGDAVFSGTFENPGLTGITAAYCRDAGQMVIVATGIDASSDELVAFHSRLVATLRCGAGKARDQREVLVPRFRVPGVGYVANTQPPTFAGVDGAMYTFHPAIGDASGVFSERPELLAEMVAAMGVTVSAEQRESVKREGRYYASVIATGGETRLRITASAFYCPKLGLSFFGQHQGLAESPAGLAIDALALAACPAEGEAPVSVRQAFLAACEDNVGLACFQLARGIQGGVLEAGELDPAVLAKKACKLGVQSACAPVETPTPSGAVKR